MQAIADDALRSGLIAYDRRHGWRGPLGQVEILENWQKEIKAHVLPADVMDWRTAVVLSVGDQNVQIGFEDGLIGNLPLAELRWARHVTKGRKRGPRVKSPADVLAPGDVIAVEAVTRKNKNEEWPPGTYALRQIPAISGGLVALAAIVVALARKQNIEGAEVDALITRLGTPQPGEEARSPGPKTVL